MPRITAEPNKWRTWAILSHFVPTVHRSFSISFVEPSVKEITWLSWRHCVRKASFSVNVFFPQENKKAAFSNNSGLKSVFKKLLFRDGFVSTVGLTVEIKLRFQISQRIVVAA